MKKSNFLIILLSVLLSCSTSRVGFQNSPEYYHRYFRTFSFHTQTFNQELKSDYAQKFCYKVYFHEKDDKIYASEFINEKNTVEFIGYFNKRELIKKIDVYDYSRGRMNMEFYYNISNELVNVKLLDDNKNPFAFGSVTKSNKGKVYFIKFTKNKSPVLFHIIRADDSGNDVEIATYSTDGLLYSNHLFFYDENNYLVKYKFFKKLNFIFSLTFNKNSILEKNSAKNYLEGARFKDRK